MVCAAIDTINMTNGVGNITNTISQGNNNSQENHIEFEEITIKVSWYNPALGGTNCGNFIDGECISNMSSGEDWRNWIGKAMACPPEIPFWTKVIIDNREWICLDRGGAITYNNGVYWVDMLSPEAVYPFGTIMQAKIIKGE